ncbi:nucleotide sugar dehydrogenase [Amycolatopsis taiwanensis]|uniref:nucleotide sugar dehydrogenase n=1 Tax=Amycolatopsis taiwanensis TaxID=342230 RepID=UPI000A062583|nr:nucleotide sugar dehydrogenase [Amycolatopsis taiwanensis]
MVTDVVVVGLGYTGLTMAVAAARGGRNVVGLDSSSVRVAEIIAGTPGCGLAAVSDAELAGLLTGSLKVQADSPPQAGVHMLCVPSRDLVGAVDVVAGSLRHGDLVIIQSTCPPGFIDEVVIPRLRQHTKARVNVVHSPVRLDPGRDRSIGVPRVIAGATAECLSAGMRFLGDLGEQMVPVSSIRAAELTKVFENTFRLVNISLVNELAAVCRGFGVAVAEVLAAAATKPYGFLRHEPGPGAGGDCVPVCAEFFAEAAGRHGCLAESVEAAIAVNNAIPRNIMGQLSLRGRRVVVAGVTYKPDVADVRRSAAVRLLEELKAQTEVAYHDPYVPQLRLRDGTVLRSTPVAPGVADVVLLVTRHLKMDISGFGASVIDCSSGFPCAVRTHDA